MFEKMIRENFITNYEKVSSDWGNIPKKFGNYIGKNTYEIDIVGVNEKNKEILFGECKWQDNIDANIIMAELHKKAKYVLWNKDKMNESYVIFAKSFRKKISSFNDRPVKCYDLKNLGQIINLGNYQQVLGKN